MLGQRLGVADRLVRNRETREGLGAGTTPCRASARPTAGPPQSAYPFRGCRIEKRRKPPLSTPCRASTLGSAKSSHDNHKGGGFKLPQALGDNGHVLATNSRDADYGILIFASRDDLGPLGDLGLDPGGELVGRIADRVEAERRPASPSRPASASAFTISR